MEILKNNNPKFDYIQIDWVENGYEITFRGDDFLSYVSRNVDETLEIIKLLLINGKKDKK